MKSIITLALFVVLLVPELLAGSSPRTYVSAINIGETEVARFEIASPRMPAAEFGKTIANEELRTALNRLHLNQVGTLDLIRDAQIGGRFVTAATYQVGIEVAANNNLTLILTSGQAPIRIGLEAISAPPIHVPQPTISFLSLPDIESFILELRFGSSWCGASMSFALEDVVAGMNNLAYEMLIGETSDQDIRQALILATRANHLTQGQIPGILDTLALAQYQNGELRQAIQTQQKALGVIGTGTGKERTRMEAQLRKYLQAANGN